MTHVCVSDLTIIGSDNGLSPGRRQAIIWISAGILLIGPLGTNFSEILIEILIFSFKKMRLKVSSAKRRSFCLGLNVLTLSWHREFKSFLTERKDPLILHSHFHSCWWLGDARRQRISSHDIDQVTRMFNTWKATLKVWTYARDSYMCNMWY